MEQVYTVSQVNSYIKSIIAREYVLGSIIIRGEISNCKYHSSGHIYFTLKDAGSRIACVMFAGSRRSLTFTLADGMSVLASGSIGVYERDGKYQLYVSSIVKDGVGILYDRLEKLKEKLSKEGLFNDIHKKPVPFYSDVVGIVTASTGAAVRDIVNIAKRRNPYVKLILYPVHVQGDEAAEEIAHAIAELDKLSPDVIIVGRGGGSFEDLFAFNEEVVVRAVYECKTPIISAVGHEVDTALSDYAADLRAPTPSAAAELAVCEIDSVFDKIEDYKRTLVRLMEKKLEFSRSKLEFYETHMKYHRPDEMLRQKRQFVSDMWDRLDGIISLTLERRKTKLMALSDKLNVLSPLNRLSGGYAYVTDENGAPLKSISKVKSGDDVIINISDGKIITTVNEVKEGK
ncbi:MAG: exodeoxyribonuclease VII large subunit [Lachnospiraceae bacterium]|jgi:exodeoxyribonuclease VII, large subunit